MLRRSIAAGLAVAIAAWISAPPSHDVECLRGMEHCAHCLKTLQEAPPDAPSIGSQCCVIREGAPKAVAEITLPMAVDLVLAVAPAWSQSAPREARRVVSSALHGPAPPAPLRTQPLLD